MEPEYIGDYMETFTGLHFYPQSPTVDQVCIEDIAHGLANTCRYSGQSKRFFSVAEHSILVSYLTPAPWALAGLLHDASEAYLCDIPRPVKALLLDYIRLEATVMDVVKEKFKRYDPLMGLDFRNRWVKYADNVALVTEAKYLVYSGGSDWTVEMNGVPLLPAESIDLSTPWSPEDSERRFLSRFKQLTGWFNA